MGADQSVLIAEPAEALRKQLSAFLENAGVQVLEVRTLRELILTLQSRRVDVLLLDASLLQEDCGFISVIKGLEEGLPIIICAETNTPEFESCIRKERIFYYHIKSFGAQYLEMAVSNGLNRSSPQP